MFLICFAAFNVRMAVGLQLQMPASRLFAQSVRPENGESLLVVFHQQIHGICRHGMYYMLS